MASLSLFMKGGALFFSLQEGDRVWFQGTITGACAEYCLCDENNLGVLPETASFEDGAMIGVPYLTAYRSLFQK